MNTKSSIIALAIYGIMAVTSTVSAAPKCSLKTLKGTYIYAASALTDGTPYAESGQELYDGKGNITNNYTNNTGESGTSTATYTMAENCIGESTYIDGESYAIYANPNGSEFTFVAKSKNANNVASGSVRRVSTSLIK